MNIDDFLKLAYLTYPKALHLLKPEWRQRNEMSQEPSTGFCYIAAEAAFHTVCKDYTPYVATFFADNIRQSHWWLQKENHIFDPTSKQFFGKPPYQLGRKKKFLTSHPSKRTIKFLKLMLDT